MLVLRRAALDLTSMIALVSLASISPAVAATRVEFEVLKSE